MDDRENLPDYESLTRCVRATSQNQFAEFTEKQLLYPQAPVYEQAVAELAAGEKSSHWMWFVFPQFDGLGSSSIAQRFAITSREEAKDYWQHPVLGNRLRECIELMLAIKGKSELEILDTPDDLKFRSCLTLFAAVLRDETVFAEALGKYFAGRRDAKTLTLLRLA